MPYAPAPTSNPGLDLCPSCKARVAPTQAHAPAPESLEAFVTSRPAIRGPLFDLVDEAFAREAIAERDRREGPRIGDFVQLPGGETHRLSRDAGTSGFQTAKPNECSFFLWGGGSLEFAGGHALGSFVQKEHLRLLPEPQEGEVWTFRHQEVQPGGRVNGTVPFRVFAYEPPQP